MRVFLPPACVCAGILIFHVKDVFIIVLFQPVLLTVIGVILIAVRLPLDDSAGDVSAIGFFPPNKLTARRMGKRGSEREKERGGQERDRPSISTGAGAAFIRSTIGKRETLTGLNFFLIIMTPPHPTTTITGLSISTRTPLCMQTSTFSVLLLLCFCPLSFINKVVRLFVCGLSAFFPINLWERNVWLYGKNILSGTVCIPLIFYSCI